jgi:hypothetical protein
VIDALRPLGIRHLDFPYSPSRVWQALAEARPAPAGEYAASSSSPTPAR